MSFEAVLAGAQAGDETDFAVIWRQLHPPLLRYLRVLAPSAADDLASECWLAVMRGLKGFTGDEANFKSWLFTIARSKVADWRRREQRRPVDFSDDDMAGELIALDDTEEAALGRLDTEAALALIATLPSDQAEIIMLRVVAGLEVADVARIVRKSTGAVRVNSHRALRRLRAALEGSKAPAGSEALARSGDSAKATSEAVTP